MTRFGSKKEGQREEQVRGGSGPAVGCDGSQCSQAQPGSTVSHEHRHRGLDLMHVAAAVNGGSQLARSLDRERESERVQKQLRHTDVQLPHRRGEP
ncbi:hypothetical protein SKAU_G00383340 [Synaphobranchus kaupii]|uniref:Uncharacterized protein n=1 Tax=Synaphobranchus kaupii TaxID=118154 RepID=A0A9Q1EE31_SYNKA|nr:hypothetical protein SKAU_G00383340 [Synaphobranchus kaupii]